MGGWGGSGRTAGEGELGQRDVDWGRNARGSRGSSPKRGGGRWRLVGGGEDGLNGEGSSGSRKAAQRS